MGDFPSESMQNEPEKATLNGKKNKKPAHLLRGSHPRCIVKAAAQVQPWGHLAQGENRPFSLLAHFLGPLFGGRGKLLLGPLFWGEGISS